MIAYGKRASKGTPILTVLFESLLSDEEAVYRHSKQSEGLSHVKVSIVEPPVGQSGPIRSEW